MATPIFDTFLLQFCNIWVNYLIDGIGFIQFCDSIGYASIFGMLQKLNMYIITENVTFFQILTDKQRWCHRATTWSKRQQNASPAHTPCIRTGLGWLTMLGSKLLGVQLSGTSLALLFVNVGKRQHLLWVYTYSVCKITKMLAYGMARWFKSIASWQQKKWHKVGVGTLIPVHGISCSSSSP